ncbi:MAG: cytochrome P450 [Acidimicrobiales bacterium]|nr:cytochrome P450 [Acidimicrobiales bacterium]
MQLDLCDPDFYDDPWDAYRWLREQDTLYRDETNNLWVASRYDDVFEISRDPARYITSNGVRPKLKAPLSLLCEDDPEHTRQRRMINRGFTPRRVRELTPHIRELSNQIIDDIGQKGEIDFVEDFAIHVPLIVICELMGLDPETRLKMYRWSDQMMAGDGHTDPEDPVLLGATEAFIEYNLMCAELIAERRKAPKDDLISVLVTKFDEGELGHEEFTNLDGEPVGRDPMGDDELNLFLTVLLIAGNETTRNAITGGMLALSRFPEERQRLVDHLDDEHFVDLAVDELIRWVSPVIGFTRTVTEDHERRGVQLKAGDEVLMLYQSANRDASVFDNADGLILDRDPNPHLAFGIGPHFCLGANLARLEVKTVFEELFKRLPDISVPEGASRVRAPSGLVIALQHLPATFTPIEAA